MPLFQLTWASLYYQNWKKSIRPSQKSKAKSFASTETETIFILAARLPGFTKDEIEVAKNEGEDQISIRGGGRIACQEAVITSRVSISREASLECFDESFPVPDGVDWDRIDAWFDEEEKILIISIPKLRVEEEEEVAEHAIQEERQVCEEIRVRGETQEPTEEEENEESELHGLTMPHKEKEKIMEQQAPAGILHLPKIPEESMQLSPAEDQLQQGEADDKDKIAALPEYPEMKEHLQIMQVEAERFNREEEDEAAREHITPEQRPVQKPEKKLHEEHKIPTTMKPMDKEQEAMVLGQQREPWQVIEVQQKYKTPEVTEPETREPSKVKGTAQQFQQQEEEDEQNQKKPLVKGPDQVLGTEQLIELKKEHEDIEIEEHREIKREKPQVKTSDEVLCSTELNESEKEEVELQPNEKDEEKLTRGTVYEKPIAAGWPEVRKSETEKPTLKAPKEMREAAEPIKTEKEETAELGLQKPKEEEAQEQKMPIGLSHEKTMTTKFQVPKESERKLELDRVKAPEQVQEAARDIQSEPDKELKVQEDTEPTVVREMPKTMELPPKPRVDEFNEDEYHQWMRPDKEASKTRMPLELEEIYKILQQEKEVMKRKAKKSVERAQQQLFEVSESTKSGDKEAKKVTAQPKEQEAREHKPIRQPPHEEVSASKLSEPKKPVQVHEKAGVKEPDKILEHARQIQPEDILEELQHHEDEVQDHDKFVVTPTYEKPEAAGLIENEELKPALPVLKDDEEKQWKIPDTGIPKSRESQYLHQDQIEKKEKIRQILKVKEPTQLGEEEKEAKQQLEQPGQQEPSECKKSTLHPQHEQHITTQSIEPKETDQDHKPKVTEQVQLLEGKQVQSEELVEDQKQDDQEAQEHEKPTIVPTCEKLQGTTPDQVLQDEKHFPPKQLEKEFQQHEDNWQQKKEKHTIVSTCEKPKAAEYARKEEPKPQISEFQGDENHQRIGPDIETFTAKKLLKLEEESELPQKEQEIGQEEKELQEKEAPVHKKPEPGKTKKQEQQRDQLNRKPMNQEETTLLDSEAEKEKIPTAITVGTKGMLQSREPYEKSEKPLHVEAELQLKRPKEIETRKRLCPGVGPQLLDKPAVGPSERESQTKEVQQATEYSIPRIQPPDSKQPKELEGPRSRRYIKEESKEQLEQQFKKPDEEEAQKRESPTRELTHNGAIREPPDQAVHVKAVMEQEVYTSEGGELEQDIESPKLQKPPPFSSKLEDRKVLERFDTTVKPPKPLPRISGVMKALLTMEKEATEPSIPSPRISRSMEPEGSPLQPSPDEEAIEREFPSLIQKELHPYTDLQKPEEQETASRQMPEFQEAAAEQQGKTNELLAPHKAQEEIEQLAEEVPHKIFEVPQHMKIRELELHTPKELEEEQEENPPSPLGHDMKTLEEVSQDEADASGAEMDKITKVTKLSRRRRFRCRCQGRRPAFPVPPSTVLSGSAFVFSIMVLVFHFIKRKKSNIN